jgi:hypothetical protein
MKTESKQALNSRILNANRVQGVTWHHATWLAAAQNFLCMPAGVRALSYEAQEGGDCLFIDSALRLVAKNNEGPEQLLNDLEAANLNGWLTLVKLPNRMYLENGEFNVGVTTIERWFYAEDIDGLTMAINKWAAHKISDMKQNSLATRTQNAITETVRNG